MARVKREPRFLQKATAAVATMTNEDALKATAVPSFVSCIDLTADGDEDSEEDDEPLGHLKPLQPPTDKAASNVNSSEVVSRIDDEESSEDDVPLELLRKPTEQNKQVHPKEQQYQEETADNSTPDAMEQDDEDDEDEQDEAFPLSRPSEQDETMSQSTTELDDDERQAAQPSKEKAQQQQDASLEDGEIFEEGVVPKSPSTIKQVIEQERRSLGFVSHTPPQQRKKNKKRGKKKSKRKLEAITMPLMSPSPMMMMHMPEYEYEFERTVRHKPMPVPLHGPLFPRFPPSVAPPPPLPPSYGEESIVRVNRGGLMEVLNVPPSEPEMLGGFRYRTIPVPLSTTKKSPSQPAEESDDFDLDSLRLAALRTKKKAAATAETEAPTTTTPDTTATATTTSSSTTTTTTKEATEATASPQIDELREAILKSMKKRRREPAAGQEAAPTQSPTTDPQPTTPPTPPEANHPPSTKETAERTKTPSRSPSPPSRPPPPPSSSAASTTTTTTEPRRRPLTAATQSIVIQLSPTELTKANPSDTTTQSKSVDHPIGSPPSIHAAIAEMKRQIAEKENQLRRQQQQSNGTTEQSAPPKPVTKASSVSSASTEGNNKSETLARLQAALNATDRGYEDAKRHLHQIDEEIVTIQQEIAVLTAKIK